jgi:hypothetical protein
LPPAQVMKMFHPPWSGGALTARRVITLPQSLASSWTLTPIWRSCWAISWAELFMKAMLVACMT